MFFKYFEDVTLWRQPDLYFLIAFSKSVWPCLFLQHTSSGWQVSYVSGYGGLVMGVYDLKGAFALFWDVTYMTPNVTSVGWILKLLKYFFLCIHCSVSFLCAFSILFQISISLYTFKKEIITAEFTIENRCILWWTRQILGRCPIYFIWINYFLSSSFVAGKIKVSQLYPCSLLLKGICTWFPLTGLDSVVIFWLTWSQFTYSMALDAYHIDSVNTCYD